MNSPPGGRERPGATGRCAPRPPPPARGNAGGPPPPRPVFTRAFPPARPRPGRAGASGGPPPGTHLSQREGGREFRGKQGAGGARGGQDLGQSQGPGPERLPRHPRRREFRLPSPEAGRTRPRCSHPQTLGGGQGPVLGGPLRARYLRHRLRHLLRPPRLGGTPADTGGRVPRTSSSGAGPRRVPGRQVAREGGRKPLGSFARPAAPPPPHPRTETPKRLCARHKTPHRPTDTPVGSPPRTRPRRRRWWPSPRS